MRGKPSFVDSTAHPSVHNWHLYIPKLITVLREGYSFSTFGKDALAGLTVAIVALPLAMALAIASGATPDKGVLTAVVAGFLISALGGSQLRCRFVRPSCFRRFDCQLALPTQLDRIIAVPL